MLAKHDKGMFVTGSRYCAGGRSDYVGYRDFVSRLGNMAARQLLNLNIRELTTYFRVLDVGSLQKIPLRYIHSDGYSYGVQLIYYLRKTGVKLREVPIHFVDRTRGVSKIPKLQILVSAFDLFVLSAKRLQWWRDMSPDVQVEDACSSCGDRVLTMKHTGQSWQADASSVAAYRCTAVGARTFPPVYTCLNCGLDQVPASLVPKNLEELYSDVVDDIYLKNIDARRKTFARCLDRIQQWFPESKGKLLEVGSYCGLFLAEAASRGWTCAGVEPSRWAAGYARDIARVNVHTGFLADNANRLDPEYDVVVSWDVLEHVRNPVDFLRECGEKLAPNGLLFISTLDTSNWLPRLLGRRWPWLMDMHIQYFDLKTVRDVLLRAGFELIASEPYTHYARASYAIKAVARVLPAWIPVSLLANLVPDSIMVPVAAGDIKMYVARKLAPNPATN